MPKTNEIFTIPLGARVTLTPAGVIAVSRVRGYQWAHIDLTTHQFVVVRWVQGFVTYPERYFQYGISADSSDDEEAMVYVDLGEIQIWEPRSVVRRRLTVRACDV